MDGLSAKVFRTYNASDMLEKQLAKLTPRKGSLNQNISAYHQANREVARLCNHKRAVPKSFDTAMKKLEDRIERKEDTVEDLEEDLSDLKRGTRSVSVCPDQCLK
jgi:DNA topoisomerase-1